jgi:hypothetical protein
MLGPALQPRLPVDVANRDHLISAVCQPHKLWHRGGVTLNRDETAGRAVGRTARLRGVRCPRSRIVRCHLNKNGPVRVPKQGVLRRMQVADVPQKWLYEPDEDPKRKHHWTRDEAGFVTVGAIFVGKCPSNMSIQLAQMLLNTGIEWSPRMWPEPYPQRIYCVWMVCYTGQHRRFRAARTTGSRNTRRSSLLGIGRCAIRS